MQLQRLGQVCKACLTVLLWYGIVVSRPSAGVEPAARDDWVVTASSEWGPGYGAAQAADEIAGENGNYWQTVQGKDRGAWWQADLGEAVPIRGVKVAWARYEEKYHCPPARMVVEVSLTGAEGSWKQTLAVGAERLPRDQAAYEPERSWDYPFPEAIPARHVRLLFPDGAQPKAKYEGYLCLGEVEVLAPGVAPQLAGIEGPFGKVEVNVRRPSLATLYLRGSTGLGPQSLSATSGRRPWARGAYTYAVAEDGKRYESRRANPEKVEVAQEGGRTVLRLVGVSLACEREEPPVASDDWTLHAPGHGGALVWTIARRWRRDFVSTLSGFPGLFFSFDARHRKNSTTNTIWYDPLHITTGHQSRTNVSRLRTCQPSPLPRTRRRVNLSSCHTCPHHIRRGVEHEPTGLVEVPCRPDRVGAAPDGSELADGVVRDVFRHPAGGDGARPVVVLEKCRRVTLAEPKNAGNQQQ